MSEGQRKILIATTVSSTIRAFLLPYADHLRDLGWQVDALSSGTEDDEDLARHFDSIYEAPWKRTPLSLSNYSAMKLTASLVEESKYDIVHVHTPVAAFVAREALRHLRETGRGTTGRPKIVYTAHGFHFYRGGSRRRNFVYRTLEKRAGRWTDRLIVINREDYAAASAYGLVPPEKLVYMPGIGLDFSRYDRSTVKREDILAARTEMGLKEDDILYVMMAEFNPGKRHADVIEALTATRDSKIHVAFAGTGLQMAKMQDLARAHGVYQRTHFLGFVKDPKPLLLASRAALIPSEREGLSRTAMEAACLRVPIIGSDARGVRDVVEHGRGTIYPVGNISSIRDAMLRFAEEPYRSVGPDPDWRIDTLIAMHDRLYGELLDEARAEREAYARHLADRAEHERAEAERRERERIAREAEREAREREKAERAARRAEEAARRAAEKEAARREKEARKAEERARKEDERARRDAELIRQEQERREMRTAQDRERQTQDESSKFTWRSISDIDPEELRRDREIRMQAQNEARQSEKRSGK